MSEEQILRELIKTFDDMIVLKGWKELVSDLALKLLIEKGFKELKSFSPAIAKEFLETAEAFLVKDKEGLVDESADLAAELFKKLVFKI